MVDDVGLAVAEEAEDGRAARSALAVVVLDGLLPEHLAGVGPDEEEEVSRGDGQLHAPVPEEIGRRRPRRTGLGAHSLQDDVALDRPGRALEDDQVRGGGPDHHVGLAVAVDVHDHGDAVVDVRRLPEHAAVGAIGGGAGDQLQLAVSVEVGGGGGQAVAGVAQGPAHPPLHVAGGVEDGVAEDDLGIAVLIKVGHQ